MSNNNFDALENNEEILTRVNDEGTNTYTSNTHEKSKNNFEYIKKLEGENTQLKRIIKEQSEEIKDLNVALNKTSFKSADQIVTQNQTIINNSLSEQNAFNLLNNRSYCIIIKK